MKASNNGHLPRLKSLAFLKFVETWKKMERNIISKN